MIARPKPGHHLKRPSRLKHASLKYVRVDLESLGPNEHFGSKFGCVSAKKCKSAFEKNSFADVGDIAGCLGPSCHLHYVCVVLCS